MNIAVLIDSLVTAGRSGDFASIATRLGAKDHGQIVSLASAMRGPLFERVASMTKSDRAEFAKALAVYEDTVGGVGSVTALEPVLGLLFQNDVQEGREVHSWILEHTSSNRYYVSPSVA